MTRKKNMSEQIKAQRETFGRRLRAYREARGLTHASLAEATEAIGASKNRNFSHWEQGIVMPNVITAAHIAVALGIHLDDLVGLRPQAGALVAHRRIIHEVELELHRQHAKWGENRTELHPMVWLAILTEEVGEVASDLLEHPDDTVAAELELIQVAAVAIDAVVNLRRRQATDGFGVPGTDA